MLYAVQNPKCIATLGLASSAFARHYSQNLVDFFSYGYLDVSVPHVPHLKLFRGEPAIFEFDWNFSAIHSSSGAFLTTISSDLHSLLRLLHPDHG